MSKLNSELDLIKKFGKDGEFEIVGSENGEFICTRFLKISTGIFHNEVAKAVLEVISNAYIKKLNLQHKELTTGESLDILIKDALEKGNSYSEGKFNRYEQGNLCPDKEFIGMNMDDMAMLNKLFFDSKFIKYYFYDGKIIGVNIENEIDDVNGIYDILFIINGLVMPVQQSLFNTGIEVGDAETVEQE